MKNNYEMPLLDVLYVQAEDVITTSGETSKPTLSNGGTNGSDYSTGWGDF